MYYWTRRIIQRDFSLSFNTNAHEEGWVFLPDCLLLLIMLPIRGGVSCSVGDNREMVLSMFPLRSPGFNSPGAAFPEGECLVSASAALNKNQDLEFSLCMKGLHFSSSTHDWVGHLNWVDRLEIRKMTFPSGLSNLKNTNFFFLVKAKLHSFF